MMTKKQTKNLKTEESQEKNNELVDNLKNQLARALADYDNQKKRSEEERNLMYKMASVSFMSKLLPIIDNLRQAQNHVNDSGIAIIIGQLETLAKDEGFEEIKVKIGDVFDETVCEVIEVVETENQKEDNIISDIILSGWKYSDGSVVRHARVKAFKLNENNIDSEEKPESVSDMNGEVN